MEDVLERLNAALKDAFIRKGIFKKSEMAEYLGYKNPYLSGIINGKEKMSDTFLKNISDRLRINSEWIKTGIGQMIIPENNKEVFNVKEVNDGAAVYDIDCTCGYSLRTIDFSEEKIIGHINMPGVNNEDKIIRANGDSMMPTISDGDWVAVREVIDWSLIFYGQIYLIITDEYRLLKHIRRCDSDEKNRIILHSENPDYDDMILERSKIRHLFVVKNILSLKIQF